LYRYCDGNTEVRSAKLEGRLFYQVVHCAGAQRPPEDRFYRILPPAVLSSGTCRRTPGSRVEPLSSQGRTPRSLPLHETPRPDRLRSPTRSLPQTMRFQNDPEPYRRALRKPLRTVQKCMYRSTDRSFCIG
jgi:hypothetical protein